MTNEQLLLSLQVEDSESKKYGVYIYHQSTKFLFMPGAVYIFLFFFLINLFLGQDSDRFLLDVVVLTGLTTFLIEGIFWGVKQMGLLYLKKKLQGYKLDFYTDKIVRTKRDASQTTYHWTNIQKVKHFADFDLVYHKEHSKSRKKELIIPYDSMDGHQKEVYRKMMASFY